jgi:uncharacterized protein (DUF1697 family)
VDIKTINQMNRYVALLRGINVVGKKIIRMQDLKQLFESLNFNNVITFIQSGNVVFDVDNTNAEYLAKTIEEKILEVLKMQVSVLIRNHSQLQSVIANNPFLNNQSIKMESLYVTFLSDQPDVVLMDKIGEFNSYPDEFQPIDKEIYVYCPNGYGKTKLSNSFFESKLKLKATTRNWRNINVLKEMSDSK